MADRCLRTQFISPIEAPDLSKAAVIARFSASDKPAAGAASRARPTTGDQGQHTILRPQPGRAWPECARLPPRRQHPAPGARPRRSRSARMARHGRSASRPVHRAAPTNGARPPGPWPPMPCRRRSRSAARHRPAANAGGTQESGSAAAMAASNNWRRMSRGVISAASRGRLRSSSAACIRNRSSRRSRPARAPRTGRDS